VDLRGERPFDVDKAKQLASDYRSRHGQPLSFDLIVLPSPEKSATAQFLQQQLAAAGIEMRVKVVDVTVAAVSATLGNFQAFLYELAGGPTLNPEFANLEAPAAPPGQFSLNLTRIDDPPMRAAIARSRATADPAAQADATKDVQRRLADNRGYLFLVHKRSALVFDNKVHGADAYRFPNGSDGRFGPVNVFAAYFWLST
jgi:ABC-type transport system substrate-binding protein